MVSISVINPCKKPLGDTNKLCGFHFQTNVAVTILRKKKHFLLTLLKVFFSNTFKVMALHNLDDLHYKDSFFYSNANHFKIIMGARLGMSLQAHRIYVKILCLERDFILSSDSCR